MVKNTLRRHGVTHHHRLASAHDAGLFKAYGLAVRPQQGHVVEVDAGDQGAIGVKYVHRIQAAPQADFQNHHVKLGVRQQLQDGQRCEFKVA